MVRQYKDSLYAECKQLDMRAQEKKTKELVNTGEQTVITFEPQIQKNVLKKNQNDHGGNLR